VVASLERLGQVRVEKQTRLGSKPPMGFDRGRLARAHACGACRTSGGRAGLHLTKHRFDIDHRRSVDRFDGTNSETVLGDFPDGDLMHTDRIGPIGRACCKHTSESPIRIRTWMDFQSLSLRSMQPSQNDDYIDDSETIQGLHGEAANLKPGVWCTLRTLFWCFAALFDFRADHPDRAKLKRILLPCFSCSTFTHAARVSQVSMVAASTRPACWN